MIYELLHSDDKISLACCNSAFLKGALRTGQIGAIHREDFFAASVFNKVRSGRIGTDLRKIKTGVRTGFEIQSTRDRIPIATWR